MTIKVLIVDDSTFICKLIKRILEEDAEFSIVGFAVNGREAIIKTAALEPDVITMDVEMPVMDGITAVKRIMAEMPTPILMFSAMTQVGAQATLDALSAGAIDFLPKSLEDIDGNLDTAKQQLRQRVRMVASATVLLKRQSHPTTRFSNVAKSTSVDRVSSIDSYRRHEATPALRSKLASEQSSPDPKKALLASQQISPVVIPRMKLLVIVASTGGPVAIQKILTELPARCSAPVLLIQHMPASFTRSFAERLDSVCHIRVKEAEQGDLLVPGTAFLAPGGMQLSLYANAGSHRIDLRTKAVGEIYAPCADMTLASVAEHFPGQTLTVVLTGMGADGKEGAIKLKRGGATVWAQNEASCIIYGMPKAVVDAKLADRVFALDELAAAFKRIS